MSGLAFFDTNVLVYADDASAPEKQDRSIALFAEHLGRGTAVGALKSVAPPALLSAKLRRLGNHQ